jgi:hypothetical protein
MRKNMTAGRQYFIVSRRAGRYDKCAMFNSLLLIFDTARTWGRIAAAKRSSLFVLLSHLLPLLLLISLVEGYSLMQSGRTIEELHRVKKFGLMEISVFEAVQFLLTVAVIFFSAKLIQSMASTFHGRLPFKQPFATVAYGLSPLFLLRFFDAIPGLSPWITWGVGIILSIAILYHGVPLIMQPDPPHAFGLYLTSSLLLFLTTGLIRLVTIWYLVGKFERFENLIPPH